MCSVTSDVFHRMVLDCRYCRLKRDTIVSHCVRMKGDATDLQSGDCEEFQLCCLRSTKRRSGSDLTRLGKRTTSHVTCVPRLRRQELSWFLVPCHCVWLCSYARYTDGAYWLRVCYECVIRRVIDFLVRFRSTIRIDIIRLPATTTGDRAMRLAL